MCQPHLPISKYVGRAVHIISSNVWVYLYTYVGTYTNNFWPVKTRRQFEENLYIFFFSFFPKIILPMHAAVLGVTSLLACPSLVWTVVNKQQQMFIQQKKIFFYMYFIWSIVIRLAIFTMSAKSSKNQNLVAQG